ncbi:glycosyltransferase family 2 protein [Pseudohoeflea suaedae]|uniref:Glycosyltransferase family 2 protein n=1 Tax=Pseudohoeflea suaedae TaxID=877384 RepID=A0A4R5PP08_9HYPH|nr:glycosyltransferase family 2 protein [Pseudohoeflea suaedae]TDH38729.1 glycosyltransferase family 2 protein [Pseudohoeflea suaedae]
MTALDGLERDGDLFTVTAGRPEISIEPDRPFAAGWYRISLIFGAQVAGGPRIVFTTGEDGESFPVWLQTRGGRSFSALFRLPVEARRIRIEPDGSVASFRIEDFQVRRLSSPETSMRLGLHATRIFLRDPAGFARRLPEYYTALRRLQPIHLREGRAARQSSVSYKTWISRHDFDPAVDGDALRREIEAIAAPPLISIVMPVYNTPRHYLDAAIESVRAQIYPHWELCIADDGSTAGHIRPQLEAWRQRDERIRVVSRETNGHISEATNSAFALTSGDWIALLDHDDILRENALAEVALQIERAPASQVIYSDEDKIDDRGNRFDPYFKPDFSRELFRSQNYLNHLTVHRADNIRAVGGWRTGFEGSQDYDITLRIFERVGAEAISHIPKILYHWRAASGSTAAAGSEKSYAYEAGLRALQEHLDRAGIPGTAEEAPEVPYYRIRLQVPQPAPLVSLIIPTRDKVDVLRCCVESIRARTDYPNYEITIVDNGSKAPETLAYFDELRQSPGISILPHDAPFNFSAMNNRAASQARGEILGLINNDMEVISPAWLTEMVSWACRTEIGCVGAKLFYPDGRIQHAGVITGIGGVAGHAHKYFQRDDPGYFSRLKLLHNVSAVTAACLVIRKSVYEEVGGLDERSLQVAFNDVDFCLKVREAGYANVWTPYAKLYHHESVSRGSEDTVEKRNRFANETEFMIRKWGAALWNDPYYSRNLTLEHEDFSIGSHRHGAYQP